MAEDKTWRPLELIKVTADYLASKGVPNARLDAETLLVEAMGLKRRVDLYAGFETEVGGKQLAAFREMVRRRSGREPVSRILGVRGFMDLLFAVTPDVLSPRPETELLVEAAIETVKPKKAAAPAVESPETGSELEQAPETVDMSEEMNRLLDSYAEDVDDADSLDDAGDKPAPALREATPPPPRAAGRQAAPARKAKAETEAIPTRKVRALDLGTGSGCIATALAAHLPGAMVVAVDASRPALAVARANAERAGVAERVDFRHGDWFAACREGERFDLILSNPPYLVEGDPDIWPEVSRFDPAAALYGGRDGLDCYRRIIPAAPDWLADGGVIFLEVGAGQAPDVADMLRQARFADVATLRDYGGVERAARGTMRRNGR